MCCAVPYQELFLVFFFFFQAEDGIRDYKVTGVQTCALPIYLSPQHRDSPGEGCPAAALAVDVARAGGDLSAVFAEGVERNIGRFARVIGTLGDDQEIGRASCRERV